MRMPWQLRKNRWNGQRARVSSTNRCAAWVETLEVRTVLAAVGVQMPDFQLPDENLNSDLFGDSISPREYLQQVSGWYFIHTT